MNRGEQTLRAVTGSGGRLHFGMVAGIKSERWPTSNRNPWPDCVGIRIIIGIVGEPLISPAILSEKSYRTACATDRSRGSGRGGSWKTSNDPGRRLVLPKAEAPQPDPNIHRCFLTGRR